jgi:TorA maturation chaperone TorD
MRLHKTAYRVFTQFVLNTEQYMVNQIKENETVSSCSINRADKKYKQIFVKKHEGKRPLKRSQYRKKIIIIDFRAVS